MGNVSAYHISPWRFKSSVSLCEYLPTFRKAVSSAFTSGSKSLFGILDSEAEGTTFFQSVWSCLTADISWHLRRLEFSSTELSEPHNSNLRKVLLLCQIVLWKIRIWKVVLKNKSFILLLINRYNLYKVLACSTAFFQLSLFCAIFFKLCTFIFLISSKTLFSQRVLGLPTGLLDMGFHLLIFWTLLSSAMR